MLKKATEIGEGRQFEKVLASRRLVDDFVLEDPCEVVGDKDGVESSGEGGVDIGARAVADHPSEAGFAAVVAGEREVGFVVLLGQDFDGGEVGGQSRAAKFIGLFVGIAFGDEDEAVACREVGEGFGDVGEELDLLLGDGLSEAGDAVVLFGGDGGVAELLEAIDERTAEAA